MLVVNQREALLSACHPGYDGPARTGCATCGFIPGLPMSGEDWSGNLVARWRQGDQQAAAELFHRYASRLTALARSQLSGQLAHRIDPEDVVQSVCRCFFADTREGRYELQRGGDLWRL